MAVQHHIIKRQIIDLKIDGRLTANDIQDRVSQIYKDKLVPILNRYLDTLSETDRIDRISNLEIDLGAIRNEDLEFALEEKLEEQLYLANPKITSQPKQMPSPDTDEPLPPVNQPETELVAYFLQTGALPWWVKEDKQQAFKNAVHSLLGKERVIVSSFFGRLLQDHNALKRLIFTADDALLDRILTKVAPKYKAAYPSYMLLHQYLGQGYSKTQFKELWWTVLLTNTLRLPATAGKTTAALFALYFDKLTAQESALLKLTGTSYSALATFYQQSSDLLQAVIKAADVLPVKSLNQQKDYSNLIVQLLEKEVVINSTVQIENLYAIQVIWNKIRGLFGIEQVDYKKFASLNRLTNDSENDGIGVALPVKGSLVSGANEESMDIPEQKTSKQISGEEYQNSSLINKMGIGKTSVSDIQNADLNKDPTIKDIRESDQGTNVTADKAIQQNIEDNVQSINDSFTSNEKVAKPPVGAIRNADLTKDLTINDVRNSDQGTDAKADKTIQQNLEDRARPSTDLFASKENAGNAPVGDTQNADLTKDLTINGAGNLDRDTSAIADKAIEQNVEDNIQSINDSLSNSENIGKATVSDAQSASPAQYSTINDVRNSDQGTDAKADKTIQQNLEDRARPSTDSFASKENAGNTPVGDTPNADLTEDLTINGTGNSDQDTDAKADKAIEQNAEDAIRSSTHSLAEEEQKVPGESGLNVVTDKISRSNLPKYQQPDTGNSDQDTSAIADKAIEQNVEDAIRSSTHSLAEEEQKVPGESGRNVVTDEISRSNLPQYQQPQFRAASGKLISSFSDTDRLYIPYSGLVLLWPFLDRFFSSINLIGEAGFIDATAATKACLLLQYIAEGSQWQRFEPNLPLNKLLCGIDLFEPVDVHIEITEDELAAADHLLEAVIGNAPLWKSLTADGLRSAYLQRDGILSSRDGNWLLQVQRQTYDILLDRLPWSMSIVKLPWMNNLIFVEWQQS